ncbi:MAG: hypothetical protein WCH30_01840 [Chlorobiaceae bacterium]
MLNHSDDSALISSVINKYSKKEDYSPVKNISIDIETEVMTYKLIRLNDEQFYLLRKNSVTLFENYGHLMSLSRDKDNIYSSFPKMYITLKDIFGESGKYYDDYKGSFSFPFLISFQKGEEEYGYVMNIYNVRSAIEFNMAKLIHADDKTIERGILYRPFDEFPESEITYFINFIIGYLTGYYRMLMKEYDEFFFHSVQSNLILYGYKDGNFFENQYDSQKKFDKAIQELRAIEISKKTGLFESHL